MAVTDFLYRWTICEAIGQSRISQMNEAFRAQQSLDTTALLNFLGIIFLAMMIAGFIYLVHYHRQRQFFSNNPQSLFRELCSAHSLNGAQRRALKKLSHAKGLVDPGLVFIDSSLWLTNVEAERRLGGKARRTLCELRSLLFSSTYTESRIQR